jgi:hypothetical protein
LQSNIKRKLTELVDELAKVAEVEVAVVAWSDTTLRERRHGGERGGAVAGGLRGAGEHEARGIWDCLSFFLQL